MKSAEPLEPEAPVEEPVPATPARGRKKAARKRGKGTSDAQFLAIVGAVVMGGGFLVARFILEMPVWQSLLVAPIAFLALVLTLVTWSWFTPAGRR